MDPTLKQLRAFVVVADAGQLTRAADRLNLSQSAVSTLIRQLERNLELRLFDRHTRLLRLTQVGEEILPIARRAVADIDSIVENVHELNILGRGRVSIAAGTVQAALLLPRLIDAFNQAHPNIDVGLHDVSEKTVLEMVARGVVDLGVGTVPEGDSEIVGAPLTTDQFVVVMRPDHPLARRRKVRWRDLAGSSLIGPQRGNPVRDRLEAELAREGIALALHRSMQDVSLPLTIIGLVEGGLGVAIMTTAVARLAASMGLTTVTPVDPVIAREVSVIVRRDRALSPAARQFRHFLLRESHAGHL